MITLLLSLFILFIPSPQQKEQLADTVSAKITDATLYRSGALVTRKATVNLSKGTQRIVFNKLSRKLQKQTIQVSGEGVYTILSVKTSSAVDKETIKKYDKDSLNLVKSELQDAIRRNKSRITTQERRLSFLDPEKLIRKNVKYTTTELDQFLAFYGTQSDSIEGKLLDLKFISRDLNAHLNEVYDKLEKAIEIKLTTSNLIIIDISSEKEQTVDFSIAYLVSDAGWKPSYDIRVDEITEPVELIYKASIYQNSGYDWKDVQLTVSSSDPYEEATLPSINPWLIDFSVSNNRYKITDRSSNRTKRNSFDDFVDVPVAPAQAVQRSRSKRSFEEVQSNSIFGVVTDETGEAIPGVNVVIPELVKGDATDIEGQYVIAEVPKGEYDVSATFTGYKKYTTSVSMNGGVIPLDITMEDDILGLDDLVIVGYQTVSKREVSGAISKVTPNSFGGSSSYGWSGGGSRRKSVDVIPIATLDNQISTFSYIIEKPYSVISDDEEIVAIISRYEVNTSFKYAATPKLNPNAFLLASLTDWGKLNLLTGTANLYLQNTFIGATTISPEITQDTLSLSLGTDKGIVIQRNPVKDLESRTFLKGKTKETKTFEINVRNTKLVAVNIDIYDQIPVSLDKGIKISMKDQSGGIFDKEAGVIAWNLDLEPSETKTIRFTYEIQYPKKKRL